MEERLKSIEINLTFQGVQNDILNPDFNFRISFAYLLLFAIVPKMWVNKSYGQSMSRKTYMYSKSFAELLRIFTAQASCSYIIIPHFRVSVVQILVNKLADAPALL